ncbi:S-adenosyl-L-methionine-dependent methyltransferase [Mycena indigotica]|uniref:S-adenosyl-L-methionine-dependent methyltransferase n=1 Tax=Mycena indigotica TaxID=2126181 RepID=A0A8H6S9P8_9AGAR|nr:S-adenosyl-L-methionine-dependent methyltransferase [Mycena indigotica]KAF7295429.1 S-adenosyl-L-methionine-dependent methyltransferase [Mycena indigotica]
MSKEPAPAHSYNHDHTTARQFQQWTGSSYPLPADAKEKERLQLQHDAIKKLYEDRILLAPVDLDKKASVLETGTGSGIWVVDLAGRKSNIDIVAVDIESRNWPTSPPKNIEFILGTVLELPKEWDNKFALVHQRLLLLALAREQWPVALKEMYRVLKPGGWVQLGETKIWPNDFKDPARPCTEKLATLYRALADSKELYIDCAESLGKMLAAAGFTNIKGEIRMQEMGVWAGERGEAWRKDWVGVFNGIETSVMDNNGFDVVKSMEEYDLLLDGFEEECDTVKGGALEFIIFYAQKPL